jgi:hypothetical protein
MSAQTLPTPSVAARQPDVPNRAMSQDLEDLARDYQASLQELQAARFASESNEIEAPIEALNIDDTSESGDVMTAQPDLQLEGMIQGLRSEISSLRSIRSSLDSTTVSSIYSSLSAHSVRLSLLADNLLPETSPAFEGVQRMSVRMSQFYPELPSPIQDKVKSPMNSPLPVSTRATAVEIIALARTAMREAQAQAAESEPLGDDAKELVTINLSRKNIWDLPDEVIDVVKHKLERSVCVPNRGTVALIIRYTGWLCPTTSSPPYQHVL